MKKISKETEHNAKEQDSEDLIKELENGDFDSEDLAMGDNLSLGDFEDPEFYEDEETGDESSGESEEDDQMTFMYGLLGSFFEYDNQNAAELLCQIRDSVDSNSKCLLRVAHEIRSLHNTYIQNLLVNTNFTEDSLFQANKENKEGEKKEQKTNSENGKKQKNPILSKKKK